MRNVSIYALAITLFLMVKYKGMRCMEHVGKTDKNEFVKMLGNLTRR
jgi:hypothetical protein